MSLVRRRKSSRFLYFRQRIPTDLVEVYGGKKEVTESLGTCDLKEAKRLAHLKALEVANEWEAKRRELNLPTSIEFARRAKNGGARRALSTLSESQRKLFLHHVFLKLEREALKAGLRDPDSLDEGQREAAMIVIREDLACYTGSKAFEPIDWEAQFAKALAEHEITADSKVTPTLRKELLIQFKAAHIESSVRSLKCLGVDHGVMPEPYQLPAKVFEDLGIGSPLPEPLSSALSNERSLTVWDVGEAYRENQKESGVRQSTLAKAEEQAAIMAEVWGGKTPVSQLGRDQGIKLINVLKQMPVNGRKRYPGKSLKQMTKLEAGRASPEWISPKTVHGYYNGISAILRFAEDEGWLERSPLTSRSLRKRLPNVEKVAKPMMTPEDLNKVFKDPDYFSERLKGERGEARFWVPLLCLFHGVRSNECCQLLLEDIREEEGIAYIDLRPGNNEGEKVKRFKTGSSIRRIPLHDEIIRIGFLDFVEEQRALGKEWLFSGLEANAMGSRADAVGKWFGRFRKKCLGDDPSGVKGAKGLHSFRHLFERTLRDAGVPDSLQFALGGWSDKKANNSSVEYGDGFGMKKLKEGIDSVQFPEVDFSPLFAGASERVTQSGTPP